MNLVHCYAFNERGDMSQARQFETAKEVKTFLNHKYNGGCNFGINELTNHGCYREMAISYNFQPFLTKFLVEREDGHMQAAWAPSKTALRRALYLRDGDRVFVFPKV